ncbi:hypothetical protein EJ02DRAFT_393867 [Clathrospora elynae]|uniref:Uncharacterized protein n=1 Tax=Clathrospora elynae TaxID=706981 RepID=A0A6A5T3J1_9PLEO|nr:hypothetical protein EJ02DRAFT_393867 [Clathrospora elynae]
MPVLMGANEALDPDELALQAANIDLKSDSWLTSSMMVDKVNTLKNVCLGNCRLLYGSERFKFYDIVICEDESDKKFCAILTCNQEAMTKLLRTQVSHCPVEAVRTLVDRLQKDTARLFKKYTVGSQLQGQQGYTDKETGNFELADDPKERRIIGPDDDTAGLLRRWSDAPGGTQRDTPRAAPSGPRGGGRGGGWVGQDDYGRRENKRPRPAEPTIEDTVANNY